MATKLRRYVLVSRESAGRQRRKARAKPLPLDVNRLRQDTLRILKTKCLGVIGQTKLSGNMAAKKKGLWANIHAKRKRIKAGSGERMRKAGSKGAPTSKAFKQSAKTTKRKK